jgi:CO/xanthine dehydrogenase Mo-binding subunit
MTEPFKPRLARKYVGTYRPKIDGLEKASGRAKYADDLTIESRFPGMLYAKSWRTCHEIRLPTVQEQIQSANSQDFGQESNSELRINWAGLFS